MASELKLTCVYLVVTDMERSVNFYCSLFETEVDKRFEDRWVQIKPSGNITLGLLSSEYDRIKINEGTDFKDHYDQQFIDNLTQDYIIGNTVVLNLKADNLKQEYQRVQALDHNEIFPMQYVNFMFPYHFFTVKDPTGHLIEVADS